VCALPCALEKPAIHSSYFQQMLQDAARASSDVASAHSSLNTGDGIDTTVDYTAHEHHSSTCDTPVASSTEHPVDSSKTTHQLIG